MRLEKQETFKKVKGTKKPKSNQKFYWKLFLGLLTLLTIVLAILSRHWPTTKSNNLVDDMPTPLPKKPFLPNLLEKPPLPKSSAKIHLPSSIPFVPGLTADIRSQQYKLAYSSCQKAISHLLNETGLFPHLKAKVKFPLTIALERQDPVYLNSRGTYQPSHRIIRLYYYASDYAGFFNANRCLKTLRNEYYSYQVQVRNELNAIPNKGNMDITCPFLNARGEVDLAQYQRYKATIDQAMQKAYYLIVELKNDSKTRPAIMKKFIGKCLDVISCYEPQDYFRFKEICDINLRENWWAIDKNGRISSGRYYLNNFPTIYGQRLSNGSCTYQYAPEYN